MLGWVKYIIFSHWLQFALLATTWLGGYVIHAHVHSPLLVLYYAGHIFPACAFFGVGMYYLHPGNKEVAARLHSADPNDTTKAVHRIFFHLLRLLPITGAITFFVPDSGFEFGADGSFWTNHLYNDNFAHMVHASLFYLILLLGSFNLVRVMNKRFNGKLKKSL